MITQERHHRERKVGEQYKQPPYLGVTELVIVVIKSDSLAHLAGGDLGIDKALGNDSGCQDSITRIGLG